jgi:hypothetical protein
MNKNTSFVDITPSPRVLRMLGQIDFQPWQCLAELIDNSIDAFIDQEREGKVATNPRIWIRLPNDAELKAGSGSISVEDNGAGMSLDVLQDAVRAGYSGNDPVEKMGLFGMGFNIATARMGRRTEVWTTRKEDAVWTVIVIDFGLLEKNKTFVAPVEVRHKTEAEIESGVQGTRINISQLEVDRVRPLIWGVGKRRTRDRLGKIYGRVMKRLGITINYDGDVVRPVMHCVWSNRRSVETQSFGRVPAIIEIDKTLEPRKFCSTCWVWLLEDEGACSACGNADHVVTRARRLKGWLGIQRYFDKDKYGVDLIRNGRVIEELNKSFFTFYGADGDSFLEYPIDAIHWGGRIVGELEIDFVRVSHQKDSFDKLDPEWKRIVELVRGNSPLQPQIAARMGMPKNDSPLARLFTGYRKSTAGLAGLVPGTAEGTGLNSGLVKEFVDKFYEGDPDFQTDERWYELVEQVERARRGAGSGADRFAGEFPLDEPEVAKEPSYRYESPKGSDINGLKVDDATSIPRAEPDLTLSRDYELAELPGAIVIKVLAFRHSADIDGQPFRVRPDGYSFRFDYNSSSTYFEESISTPADYLLVDLAHQFLTLSAETPRNFPVSRVTRMLREKYFPDAAGDVYRAASDASNLLHELRTFFGEKLPEAAPIEASRISDHELENVRRSAFKSAGLSPDEAEQLVRSGGFARFVSEGYLPELVREWPSLVMDGSFFERPWGRLSESQRRESIGQVVESLFDVSWLAEDGAAAVNKDLEWRLRFTRALASLRLLNSWKA